MDNEIITSVTAYIKKRYGVDLSRSSSALAYRIAEKIVAKRDGAKPPSTSKIAADPGAKHEIVRGATHIAAIAEHQKSTSV